MDGRMVVLHNGHVITTILNWHQITLLTGDRGNLTSSGYRAYLQALIYKSQLSGM